MNPAELKGSLEAIIYAADDPATLDQLAKATETDKEDVRTALEEMIANYAADDRGVELRRVARGYRFSTKPQHHEAVRTFIKNLRPPVRLSMPALETLAVIAYKQPITLPEIQEIRGVNCSGVIQTLLEKHLVATAGRKAVIGRPILYRTTKEFLVRFGLNDVDELPSLKEFEQLAREALGPDAGIEVVPEEEEGTPYVESGESGKTVVESEGEAPAGETAMEEFTETESTGADEDAAGTELAASGPNVTAEEDGAGEGESGDQPATAVTPITEPEPAEAPPEPSPEPGPEPELPEPEPPEPAPEPAPVGAKPETEVAEPDRESSEPESPAAEEETPGERSSTP